MNRDQVTGRILPPRRRKFRYEASSWFLALYLALPSGFLGLAASFGLLLMFSLMLVRLFVVVDALPTEEEQNLSSIVRPYRQFTALPRCREAGYHPPKGNVRPRGTI